MTDLLTLEQRHERAERRVNRFVDRFEPSYHNLVCHAALPLILTPELVSYLRNEFLREVPWIAEVDLLLSDLCSPVGYELYVMDADVRAYALTECSATFTAERKREVANLLISYVRYLAEHQSYLSDRELEAQQWAAMLYLGESERQTVVSELVERFQSAETGGAMVGADLLDNAEIARLAQLTQTLKPQLTDYPELIEYAALVSDVQLRNIALERSRIEKTYVVAPGQFLRLPTVLQTELVTKGRIKSGRSVSQSASERLQLIQKFNALSPTEFEVLINTLNPPGGIVPASSAASGSRTLALLQWIEGPTGPGLNELQSVLEQVMAAISATPISEESPAESSSSALPLEPFEFIDAQFNSAQDFENDAYRLLEQKTSEIKQLILQDFEEKEKDFQVDMHPRDIQAENINESEIDISDEQRIDIEFVNYELIEIQEDSIVFQVRVKIRFAVSVGYFDFENHISSIQEVPPHEYLLWPDQLVDGSAEVSFQGLGYNLEGKLIDAEVNSVDLVLDTPILVRSVTELSTSAPELIQDLEPFEFTIATLQRSQNRPQSQKDKWNISRHRQQAYRFIESISSEIPLEMVAIPGGTFLMGSPKDEPKRLNREGPQHEVTVGPFWMSRYPITQAQWQAVACLPPQVWRKLKSRFNGENRPVEQVTWYDAVEFCARLSVHMGRVYRLPTEAEWEYACRAGTTTPFHFGDMITTEVANYDGSAYNNGPTGDSRGETTPVDHFGHANAFGLSDMHGNVWEWCEDHWHDNYQGAPTNGRAWLSEDESAMRVIRGGSWGDFPRYCRSAYRDFNFLRGTSSYIGFRVVSSAP